MITAIEYDRIVDISLVVYKDGGVCCSRSCPITRRDYLAKTAFYLQNDDDDLDDYLDRCTRRVNASYYPTLFVASESKISRDALRSGGYKITYDPDKADCIVIPEIKNYFRYAVNVAFVDDSKTLHLVHVRRNYYSSDYNFDQQDQDAVIQYLLNKFTISIPMFYDKAECLKSFPLFFIPKCKERTDLIVNPYQKKTYCLDTYLYYEGPVKLNPEIFAVWEKMDDMRLFEKQLINSDYLRYPFATLVWLYMEKRWDLDKFGPQGKQALTSLRFFDYRSNSSCLDNEEVQPEDWNLLQSYIAYKYNVDEKGGWKDSIERFDFSDFMRKKLYLKPMYIDKPMTFGVLKEMSKN